MKALEKRKSDWAKLPLLYIYIFQFIAERAGKFDQEINIKLIIETWHRHVYHLPRIYDYYLLKEMEEFGMVDKIHPQKFLFHGSKIQVAYERLLEGAYDFPEGSIEAPYLYLHVYSKMCDVFNRKNLILTGKQIITIWRKFIPNVSRIYNIHLLTEMCNYGLLRRINTQKYIFYGAKSNVHLRKLRKDMLW